LERLNNFLILEALFGMRVRGTSLSVKPGIEFSPCLTIIKLRAEISGETIHPRTDFRRRSPLRRLYPRKQLSPGCISSITQVHDISIEVFIMKLNIANPSTGAQKKLVIVDESKLRALYEMSLSSEIDGGALGDDFKGYIFKITGGHDKQGFGMKQGVLVSGRVRLLMHPGDSCFRGYNRRKGERRRKSVRGCIVSPEISALNLIIVRQGENPIPGLTDRDVPRTRIPKRASKIRKLFKLSKDDDVVAFSKTLGQEISGKNGSECKRKSIKVQRIVSHQKLQRKRARIGLKKARINKSRTEAAEYHQLLILKLKAKNERKKTDSGTKKVSLGLQKH
jgi:small subunit ribosomal protein S6e